MLRRLFGLTGLVALATSAWAGPQLYAQKTQNIRAGIVILDSAKPSGKAYGMSAAPYALFNLDRAKGVKPAAWNIYNPYAPGAVNETIQNRLAGLGFSVPLDSRVNKDTLPYWEVSLSSASDQVLSNYDFLVANPAYWAQLTAPEREKLRKFVDKGGVLWIDTAAANVDPLNNFPLAFSLTSNTGSFFSDLSNPLLNGYFQLNNNDLQLLNGATGNTQVLAPVSLANDNANNLLPLQAEFNQIRNVSVAGSSGTISYGRIGDGYLILTTRGASQMLNHVSGTKYFDGTVGTSTNSAEVAVTRYTDSYGTVREATLGQDGIAAAKLAVNMISLSGGYRQAGAGSRKTNSVTLDSGAPLLRRFVAETDSAVGTNTQAVVYKGLIVVSANNQITVFDANPGRDLDGNGNPDEGVPDYINGLPYDMIWHSQTLSGPLSSPVCAEVYFRNPSGNGGRWMDQVMVTDSAGSLHVFNLIPKDSNGVIQGGTQSELYAALTPPGGAGVYDGAPLPPTVSDGLAFLADNNGTSTDNGRIWVVNLSLGERLRSANDWKVGGNTAVNHRLPVLTSSPTVGLIPIQDNSGGFDRVLYVPGWQNGQPTHPGIVSLRLGAKGESVSASNLSYDGGVLHITTRAAGTNGNRLPVFFPGDSDPVASAMAPKLTLIGADGNPLTSAVVGNYIDGPAQNGDQGVINYKLKVTEDVFKNDIKGVRIDYTLDWGADPNALSAAAERGRFMVNTSSSAPGKVIGNIALTPRGTLYFAVGQTGSSFANGQLYGLREDLGQGSFRTICRWDLYGKHNIILNQAGVQAQGPVIEDNDGLNTLVPGILSDASGGALPLSSLNFAAGPTVANGFVYVNVNAVKGGLRIPTVATLVFNAEPELPSIPIGDIPDGTAIIQPDFAKSLDLTQPEAMSIFSQGMYIYDRTQGIIRFNSLSTQAANMVTDTLSLSEPIILRSPGVPDRLLEPSSVGSKWSPLAWYVVSQASQTTSQPLVTGNTLFVAGNSAVASILTGGSYANQKGMLWAYDATVPNGDEWLKAGVNKPWQSQMWQLQTSGHLKVNGHLRMPQASRAKSFDDYKVLLLQSTIGASNNALAVTGGEGTVAVMGNKGLYAFSQANITVCDENRVVRFDAARNLLASYDSTVGTGAIASGSIGASQRLVRPVRSYSLDGGDTLVVDAGASRVIRLDSTGAESRSISEFITDANYPAVGYVPGETTKLRNPADALTYTEYRTLGSGDVQNVTGQLPLEFWVHYVIADQGNKRLIQLVDRYTVDANTLQVGPAVTLSDGAGHAVPQLGVLVWHSPADVSGKGFAYNSIGREWVSGTSGGRYVYVAGYGSGSPVQVVSGADTSVVARPQAVNTTGGFVLFDPYIRAGFIVYDTLTIPDLSNTAFWSEGSFVKASRPSITRKFTNLKSATAKVVQDSSGNPRLAVMTADSGGVYEFLVDPTASGLQALTPRWFMPGTAFTAMRRNSDSGRPNNENPLVFSPVYAKRLDSGEVLIVNGYHGQTLGRSGSTPSRDSVVTVGDPYQGEVVLVEGEFDSTTSPDPTSGRFALGKNNLGFNFWSIHFEASSMVSPNRDITNPVFADRR